MSDPDTPRRWKRTIANVTIYGCYFQGTFFNVMSDGGRGRNVGVPTDVEWIDSVDDLLVSVPSSVPVMRQW